jgi:hypothetical protein
MAALFRFAGLHCSESSMTQIALTKRTMLFRKTTFAGLLPGKICPLIRALLSGFGGLQNF